MANIPGTRLYLGSLFIIFSCRHNGTQDASLFKYIYSQLWQCKIWGRACHLLPIANGLSETLPEWDPPLPMLLSSKDNWDLV